MAMSERTMIEVVNRQRKRRIETEAWTAIAGEMLKVVGQEGSSATVAFVSDARIRALNRKFRGLDNATDVLSFPDTPIAKHGRAQNLGDIAVSVERAEIQARENGLEFEEEISQLILHGLLHLCGYDHETDNGEMNRLELKLRKKLGI
jgi:probable rRNA maturation factor